mgnify:CR=1 FL=1
MVRVCTGAHRVTVCSAGAAGSNGEAQECSTCDSRFITVVFHKVSLCWFLSCLSCLSWFDVSSH